jgi:deoxyribodipyrimidine photolyase
MVDRHPIIVWFRDDLRLSDHPALAAAAKTGGPVIGLYVRDEESRGVRPLGGAACWWLAQPLRRLQASLQAAGAELVLRRGAAVRVIPEVARTAKASAVFWNEIAPGAYVRRWVPELSQLPAKPIQADRRSRQGERALAAYASSAEALKFARFALTVF